MHAPVIERLRAHGVAPSAQRIAIATVLLESGRHLSADEVLTRAAAMVPSISRATVYAALALFTERGLLRRLERDLGRIVYDAKLEQHHHFVDERGEIFDLPAGSLRVDGLETLDDIEVERVEIIVRGKRRTPL